MQALIKWASSIRILLHGSLFIVFVLQMETEKLSVALLSAQSFEGIIDLFIKKIEFQIY